MPEGFKIVREEPFKKIGEFTFNQIFEEENAIEEENPNIRKKKVD